MLCEFLYHFIYFTLVDTPRCSSLLILLWFLAESGKVLRLETGSQMLSLCPELLFAEQDTAASAFSHDDISLSLGNVLFSNP